jgi:hypothetical protein
MISHLHRCIFTHVPKTGGKSVLGSFGLPMLARDYDGSFAYIEDAFGHQPLAGMIDRSEFAYFKFAFARNPWDRLVSAFFYLDQGGCNEYDRAFRAVHLAQYDGDFSAFVYDLDQHLDAIHMRPQCHWLCDANGVLLADFVGRFETLAQDFAEIAAQFHLDATLQHRNSSRHRFYRDHYDNETRAKVYRVYRQDIETFAYQF